MNQGCRITMWVTHSVLNRTDLFLFRLSLSTYIKLGHPVIVLEVIHFTFPYVFTDTNTKIGSFDTFETECTRPMLSFSVCSFHLHFTFSYINIEPSIIINSLHSDQIHDLMLHNTIYLCWCICTRTRYKKLSATSKLQSLLQTHSQHDLANNNTPQN